jgi:hypothetical protein
MAAERTILKVETLSVPFDLNSSRKIRHQAIRLQVIRLRRIQKTG